MKIAYIGQKGIPAKIGGVERYVEEVAKRMAEKGHQVFVYVRPNYTDKGLKEYRGIKIINLPSVPTKNLDAITHTFLASLHALFGGYDVIHYHSIGPTSLSFIPKIFLRKTAIVATFQSQDYKHKKWNFFARKYLLFSEYLTCKLPDAVICVTRKLAERARGKYGTETRVIPNGSTVEKLVENFEALKKYGLSPGGYVLSVSRLVRHKGIHHLLEVFKNLERKNLTAGKKLVIVGDGFHTDAYVREIRKMAEGEADILFTGALHGSSLAQFFSGAYLFVQPSEAEGLSLSILEAMGYGKAVLASDIFENKEALDESGFYFRNKDVSDLEEKMGDLIANPGKILEMERKGFLRAEKHFSWDAIAGEIEGVYFSTLEKKAVFPKKRILEKQ